jgi:coproporphyrinogen III oxidase-like Fe-S oxidoreductase
LNFLPAVGETILRAIEADPSGLEVYTLHIEENTRKSPDS